ncbi:MAG: sulfatase family protein, partial [Acidimicrobiales bacterium]
PLPFGTDDPVLVQEAIAATYGMIEFIDHAIGRVLDHLDHLGIAEDTLIIFTSDHGDIMGDHSLMVKGNIHYQGVVRVPLCIAGPGVVPGRSAGLVSSVDIAPTILDRCELEQYRDIQGSTLTSVLSGTETSIRDHVLIEDDLDPKIAALTGNPARMRTLITDDLRFTRDSNGHEQLFDLRVDPNETEDRSTSDDRRGDLTTALVDAMMSVDDIGGGVGRTRAV